MSLFDLPELQFLIARLHQRDLLLSRRECIARRPRARPNRVRLLIGASLTALGRTVGRIGERLLGTPATASASGRFRE
jgi:hypothetical protein